MFNRLKVNLLKALRWGPRGVLNYLGASAQRRRIHKTLRRSVRQGEPVRGITLIGNFTQFGSPSKVARDFAWALKRSHVPFQTFNVDSSPIIPSEDVAGLLTPPEDFCLTRYSHIVEILPSVVPFTLPGIRKARIAFWEFESGFLYAYPDMPLEPCVIAMSDFNAAYFRKVLPSTCPVVKILYPFWAEVPDVPPRDEIRRRYGIGLDEFVVLFNFDYGASYNRKNPDGAMRAFAKAFAGRADVKLVFKTKSGAGHPDRVRDLRSLAQTLGIAGQYMDLNIAIPFRDVMGLTNACDVYLSLHRGEGFGLTLAEAMAMGRPVVCTDWSSTTEFCRPGCAMPVPYRMVPVRPDQVDHPYYEKVEEWAEPDVDAAAAALRRLYDDPALRASLGAQAQTSIREQFSDEHFRQSIDMFLESSLAGIAD